MEQHPNITVEPVAPDAGEQAMWQAFCQTCGWKQPLAYPTSAQATQLAEQFHKACES